MLGYLVSRMPVANYLRRGWIGLKAFLKQCLSQAELEDA